MKIYKKNVIKYIEIKYQDYVEIQYKFKNNHKIYNIN